MACAPSNIKKGFSWSGDNMTDRLSKLMMHDNFRSTEQQIEKQSSDSCNLSGVIQTDAVQSACKSKSFNGLLSQDASQIKHVNVEQDIEDSDILPDDADSGLWNVKAIVFLVLWFIFSFCNLFMNKYTLDTLKGDPTLLGNVSENLLRRQIEICSINTHSQVAASLYSFGIVS